MDLGAEPPCMSMFVIDCSAMHECSLILMTSCERELSVACLLRVELCFYHQKNLTALGTTLLLPEMAKVKSHQNLQISS